jgi:hypothetical protein
MLTLPRERWIATMRRKSGATTVIRSYGVLAGILDDAVKAPPGVESVSRCREFAPQNEQAARLPVA